MTLSPQEEASHYTCTMEEPLIHIQDEDELVVVQDSFDLKMKQNSVTYSHATFVIGFFTAFLSQFAVIGVRFLLQMRRYNKIELNVPMDEILCASMIWSFFVAVLVLTVYSLLNRIVVSIVQLLIGSDARDSYKFRPFIRMLGRMNHRFTAGGITGVCFAFMVDVTIRDETELIPMILFVLMIGHGSLYMFTTHSLGSKYERYFSIEYNPDAAAAAADGDDVNDTTIPEGKSSSQQQKEEHGKPYEIVQIV